MAFLKGHPVQECQGVPGQQVFVCEDCGQVFGDGTMQGIEDHWTALHGPPPARLVRRWRTRGGELFLMVPKGNR